MSDTGVEITAGLGGFLALFFLAIAVIFLGMDLNKRLRRLNHQEELRLAEERLKKERQEQQAAEGGASGAGASSPEPDADPEDEGDTETGGPGAGSGDLSQ